jgi:hypothetical protein
MNQGIIRPLTGVRRVLRLAPEPGVRLGDASFFDQPWLNSVFLTFGKRRCRLAWVFGVDYVSDNIGLSGSIAVIGSLAQLITYAGLKYLSAFKVAVIGSLEDPGGSPVQLAYFS